jgi:hypothetical protein
MRSGMAEHLLQRHGHFSFYCGDYPLWSVGGCESSGSPSILLLLNYLLTKGLWHNNEVGFSDFLRRSTLNLICKLPNSDESNLTGCFDYPEQFALAFNATSQLPLGTDKCGLTSTLTAAVVVDMLIPDPDHFKYESEPPISSSSVIFLIAVELALAFGVGIACLLLSLNLMRRAQADEEGDAFVQIIREQEELLVQTPVGDAEEASAASYRDELNDSGIGAWSLELISRFSPMKLWRNRHNNE